MEKFDPDVKAHLQSLAATEGVSGAEILRRAVEREMTDQGEGGALMVMVGGDDRDDADEDIGQVTCVDCGPHTSMFSTPQEIWATHCAGPAFRRGPRRALRRKTRHNLVRLCLYSIYHSGSNETGGAPMSDLPWFKRTLAS
jgi:hypothetical protein